MLQNFIQTHRDYFGDGVAAQQLGAAMLQSSGMVVPDAMPSIALFITTSSSPVLTNNEPADFNLAGGGQFHVPGAPKNRYEGQWGIIETDLGAVRAFAQLIASMGGQTNCWYYDGREGRFMRAHRLTNCAITFENIDIDGEGVSTVQRCQASVKYNYYGQQAELGTVNSVGQISGATKGVDEVLQRSQQVLNTIYAGNTLVNAIRGLF